MSIDIDIWLWIVVSNRLCGVSVVDLRAETRAYGRARLRELALDAAREVVLDRGWGAVRMGAIATAVGISRQSLHAEFGTKDDLGHALVLRETVTYLDGVAARLSEHPGDLAGAVSAATEYMLVSTRENPLLQSILTRTSGDGDVSLLSELTIQGEPMLGHAIGIVSDWVRSQWPSTDPADVRLMVETVVRLAQSHILTPVTEPAHAARDLATVACRCLRLADPA